MTILGAVIAGASTALGAGSAAGTLLIALARQRRAPALADRDLESEQDWYEYAVHPFRNLDPQLRSEDPVPKGELAVGLEQELVTLLRIPRPSQTYEPYSESSKDSSASMV